MYNLEQMQTALEAVGGQFGQGVWIGLHMGTTLNWHWSLVLEDFYKVGEKDYLNWGSKTGQRCGAYRKGLLYRIVCRAFYCPVCFDVTKQGLQQYILRLERMNWPSAREYCRTQHTDLVSVRNEKESQILKELVGEHTVWTGLFRDPWTWSGESNSSFRYWTADTEVHKDDLGKQCVTVREDHRWEQRDCAQKHQFLCSYENKSHDQLDGTPSQWVTPSQNCRERIKFPKAYMQVYKLKFTVEDSDLDLNAPQVKEDILKHIKQQLKGTSVEGVRWKTQPDGRVFRKEEPKKQDGSVCRP
ncbi:uncharacterized protein LOC141801271 [Halichoeres trimaculatus]|uniref:uncharacterized protein LOC141801271 n=1 Tax=Halichoeres trimaculatus TaxID=147232 RepID=UPI003D9EDD3F